DRRVTAHQLGDLRTVRRGCERRVPREVVAAHQLQVEQRLDTAVHDLTRVDVAWLREARGRCRVAQQDRVRRALVVVRELEADLVVPLRRVETGLDLVAALRTEL